MLTSNKRGHKEKKKLEKEAILCMQTHQSGPFSGFPDLFYSSCLRSYQYQEKSLRCVETHDKLQVTRFYLSDVAELGSESCHKWC